MERGNLTPIGKITALKTFVMSCFNHMFSSIPSPSRHSIYQLNIKMYSFIWDNKPDKISRKQMSNMKLHGGFKMVDIELFIKAQKIAWIQRLIEKPDAPYTKLFSMFRFH